ncbi:hypothetical protein [Spirillospora sp. NPDC048819]|uniref:hypothetical protein n=1 Tax=Spirillospora sp. NPDC048819 TaxID=3155268 RepID=UPI0033C744B8
MTTWWDTATGRRAEISRVFTEADLAGYTELTGGAPETGTVPEPLIAGLFSTLLGTDLPGNGTMYLKQDLRFASPARPGEQIRATVTISAVRPEKALVNLRTVATAGGRVLCEGEALVMARQFPLK